MSYNRDMPTGNCQKCINKFGTLGCCDTISNEWRYNCDDGMRYFDERKPQTNADRIRAMDDSGLADYHTEMCGCPPGHDPVCCGIEVIGCRGCWLSWLKSPVEVDNGETD